MVAHTRWSIGRSRRGRMIEAIALGDGPSLALIHGGIHGDEPGAVEMVERFSSELEMLTLCARIVIVAAVNPDGLAAGTKDNAEGVDLNRNFDARSWCSDGPPGYHPGSAPLSEPESAALAALIDRERPQRIVAVHQPFRCVNFDGPARPLAQQISVACGWPLIEEIGYPTPGSFGARYGIDAGLPVITLELPRPLDEEDRCATLRALRAACDLPLHTPDGNG